MNMNSLGTRLLFVALILGGYWLWQRQTPTPTPTIPPTSYETQVQDRAKTFLNTVGIEIPEDSEQIPLADVSGGELTGVVAWSEAEGSTSQNSVTVIAQVPDVVAGVYTVWMQAENRYTKIGNLGIAKSGFLLDTVVEKQAFEAAQKVVISYESQPTNTPTKVLLEGSL